MACTYLPPKFRPLLAALLLFAFTAVAFAQYPYPYPNPVPPRQSAPERTARVQYISGELSVAPKDTNQWTTARLNQTLPASEYIWTAKDSRAEISLGSGLFRMNSEASVTLLALNRSTVQIGVNQGEVTLTVPYLYRGEIYEIDTPNATLTVSKSGTYRVEVHPDEDRTLVTTRRGAIVATGSGPAVTIKEGEQVRFTGHDSLQHVAEKASPRDGFEEWASVRDQRMGMGRPPFGVAVGVGPWPYYGPPAPPPPVWVR
jgi:FecR protein